MNDATPIDSTAPLGRASLHDEVVERLRDLIVEGALEPGARVRRGRWVSRSVGLFIMQIRMDGSILEKEI